MDSPVSFANSFASLWVRSLLMFKAIVAFNLSTTLILPRHVAGAQRERVAQTCFSGLRFFRLNAALTRTKKPQTLKSRSRYLADPNEKAADLEKQVCATSLELPHRYQGPELRPHLCERCFTMSGHVQVGYPLGVGTAFSRPIPKRLHPFYRKGTEKGLISMLSAFAFQEWRPFIPDLSSPEYRAERN